MTKRSRLLALFAGGALVIPLLSASMPAQAQGFGYSRLNPVQKRLLSGTAALELDRSAAAARSRAATVQRFAAATATAACSRSIGSNIKVNQNCLNISDPDLQGRAQAQNETSMAADSNRPDHLLAAYNDYRRGDATCGMTYSSDGGRSWVDATVPNNFTRGDFLGKPRQYWQASGDPSVAFDSRGNAYLSCQMFNRGSAVSVNPDQSSGIFVFRSTGTHGASWNFPGRPVAQAKDTGGAGNVLEDKPFMTVDASRTSRFRDRVYVTWTLFAANGTAYIYAAHSADYGETFSAPVLVSRDSGLCNNTFRLPTPRGRCNANQFSQPFTAPDGALYVAWANYNNPVTGNDNRNQMLLARSTDGGASFSTPVKVGDFYELPDCATYQNGADPGVPCVPEKGSSTNSIFRAGNYPSAVVEPATGRVIVTFGSYINRTSRESNGCVPNGFAATGLNRYRGVKIPSACSNAIVVSASADGGHSFSGTTTDVRELPVATTGPRQARTDQWFQWAATSGDGRLVVSYYDRQYGFDETTGYSDISLSSGRADGPFTITRVTGRSMPPPTQFSGLFWGDYAGLAVTGTTAHPLWSDSRNVDLFLCPGTGVRGVPPALCTGSAPNASVANDEEIFTASVPVR